ncbi:copper amine oxidase [Aspergillus leporis]|uniref:Amine oxidase n=1 Tax=Aspergillus leporis TaxID=41062 RepID=A0A5N5WKX7_9EURO|nr:copper amine oxidase [Aspergillus leporis]
MASTYKVCSEGCCAATRKPRTGASNSHPLDPLSAEEVIISAILIHEYASPDELRFNCITLQEPRRCEYAAYCDGTASHPDRRAFSILVRNGIEQVSEAVVNLRTRQVESWNIIKNVLPVYSTEDGALEEVAHNHPKGVELCHEIGIADMQDVYFDVWATGAKDRWGFNRPLLQAFPYHRLSARDNQYAHPLDFSVVANPELNEIVTIDVRDTGEKRTPISLDEYNYRPEYLRDFYCQDGLKPIETIEPQGPSFHVEGNKITWAALKMHVGFNYREGIVLSDIQINDPYQKRERMLFNHISVAEIFMPYGSPCSMTHAPQLGNECMGAMHFLDAVTATSNGEPFLIKNAVCIHEEDNGLLYKHTDTQDNPSVSALDQKLIISQVVTAANFDYVFYHIFTLDGTYKLEVKLTGTPTTSWLNQSNDDGTKPTPKVDEQNLQHEFCLRVDPAIDGLQNIIVQNDTVLSNGGDNLPKHPTSNIFNTKKTQFHTASQGAASYCYEIAYRIFNRNWLSLYNQLESQRADVCQKALWVTPYRDGELFPAGKYLCQSANEARHSDSETVLDWAARDESIENTDIVCYVQFRLTYSPRAEDFPIMPMESTSVTLRASNFFKGNPALWVPPLTTEKDPVIQKAVEVEKKHFVHVPKL